MEIENYLTCIPDHRRGQGKLYDLGSLLLFSTMAVLSVAPPFLTEINHSSITTMNLSNSAA